MKIKKNSWGNTLVQLIILLGFFLPHNNFIFQSIHAVLPLILFLAFYNQLRIQRTFKLINYIITFIIIISYTVNVFLGNWIELKDFARLLSFVLLFGLFPFYPQIPISNRLLYFSLLFIFLSQIAYVFNFNILVNFYDRFYPYTGELRGFSSEFILQSAGHINSIVHRRYGGLYHNPNQAVRYITLLLAVFLIENKNNSLKNIYPYLFASSASLVLAGSRTGIVIGAFLIAMYFLFLRNKTFRFKGLFLVALFFATVGVVINLIYGQNELRVFQISSGIEGSLGTKVEWFFDFFKQLNSVLSFFIGHFSSSNMQEIYGVTLLDSEWGELFYSFGILGTITLSLFYFKLFSLKDKNIRFYLIILLWGISSTVLFSFRMSFLFMLFLSKYYSEYRLNRNNI
jgi:hypothetical protein